MVHIIHIIHIIHIVHKPCNSYTFWLADASRMVHVVHACQKRGGSEKLISEIAKVDEASYPIPNVGGFVRGLGGKFFLLPVGKYGG